MKQSCKTVTLACVQQVFNAEFQNLFSTSAPTSVHLLAVLKARPAVIMSSSLLAVSKQKLALRVSQTSVRYIGRQESGGDPKNDIIRRALYPSNIRNRPSPVGSWRPDVGRRLQRAIPSVQAHETIERAWFLHQRHVRRARASELQRKFESVRNAMETLRFVAPDLYVEANKEEDPRARSPAETDLLKKLKGPEKKAVEARIRGLFPRELRTPTDTPPRNGWTYDFTPIVRPS
ncbi:hypothetical protein DICSQDRAFT_164941 [Dichomitus squalens LYAD-421 SS1]|uniref:uncharacterized protein n=1 Tax=Dichomitus squalens (strain LYAD-421) TaxID=732165 RepID=UPI0004411133|nr:uncharacterized protein DICSQDRAFT_164941 [Dichomitus squalens LYAD-421 SS1]EJF67105.1 hypothetical protein DICSQDRAFT_164941 [Dichomitus squalens LYAD-421 SS1]